MSNQPTGIENALVNQQPKVDGRKRVKCSICRHEKRLDIEKACDGSRSEESIATEFGVSKSSINRHKSHIVPKGSINNNNANELGEIGKLRALVEPLLKSKDDKIKLAAIAQLKALSEFEVRIGQEANAQQELTTQPAFQLFFTHLLGIVNECATCKTAILESMPPGGIPGEK